MAVAELFNALPNSLARIFWGNSIGTWIFVVLLTVLLYNVQLWFRGFISKRLHATKRAEGWGFTRILTVVTDSTTRMFLLAISLYIGSLFLDLTVKQEKILAIASSLIFFLQLGYWGKSLVDYKFDKILDSKKVLAEQQQVKTLMVPIKFVVLAILWTIIVLAGLDNMGVNVTALIAGLGIGGVAVALAVQSTLADLLAALSIAFDKPFIVGDFIVVGDDMGTVDKIGIKSTRVKSLSGEELIFPNQDLLKSRIRNYKRMQERRVVFGFSVPLDTPPEKLKQIADVVKEVIQSNDKTRLDRAHFAKFGTDAYEFEAVYFVLDGDFNLYMDIQQAINFALIDRFESMEILFSSPTRNLSNALSKGLNVKSTP